MAVQPSVAGLIVTSWTTILHCILCCFVLEGMQGFWINQGSHNGSWVFVTHVSIVLFQYGYSRCCPFLPPAVSISQTAKAQRSCPWNRLKWNCKHFNKSGGALKAWWTYSRGKCSALGSCASNLAVRSRFSTSIRTDGMLWRKADFSLWKLLMHGSEWCRNRQLPRRLECVSWRQKLLSSGCKFQCMTGEWCAISLHMGCGLWTRPSSE